MREIQTYFFKFICCKSKKTKAPALKVAADKAAAEKAAGTGEEALRNFFKKPKLAPIINPKDGKPIFAPKGPPTLDLLDKLKTRVSFSTDELLNRRKKEPTTHSVYKL